MSKPSDNPADAFKKALGEATKVMAHDPELTVSYSVDPAGVTGDSMRLPQVSRRMTRAEVMLARGSLFTDLPVYRAVCLPAPLLVTLSTLPRLYTLMNIEDPCRLLPVIVSISPHFLPSHPILVVIHSITPHCFTFS